MSDPKQKDAKPPVSADQTETKQELQEPTPALQPVGVESLLAPTPAGTLTAPAIQPNPYAWISQTIILAACSALSYLYVYLYEAGFCEHFHIPLELIKIDTVRILIVGVSLFGIVYLCFSLYPFGLDAILSRTSSRKKRILFSFPIILFLGFLLWKATDWGVFLAALFLLAVTIYLDSAFKVRKTSDIFPFKLLYSLAPKIGEWTVNAIYYAALFAFAVKLAGTATAGGMREFLVPDTIPPNQIVLKIYGDIMICAKADFAKHEIYPVLSFHSLSSDFSKNLTLRHLKTMKVIDDPKLQ